MPPIAPRTARSFLGPPPAAASAPLANSAATIPATADATNPPQPSAQSATTANSASHVPSSRVRHTSNSEPQPNHIQSASPSPSQDDTVHRGLRRSPRRATQATYKQSRSRSRSPDPPAHRGVRRNPRRAAARGLTYTEDIKPEKPFTATLPSRRDEGTRITRSMSGEVSAESSTATTQSGKAKMEENRSAHASDEVPKLSTKAAALAVDAARAAAAARGEGNRLHTVTPQVNTDARESSRSVTAQGSMSMKNVNVLTNGSVETPPKNCSAGQTHAEQDASRPSISDTIVESSDTTSQVAAERNISRTSRFSLGNDISPQTDILENNATANNSANQSSTGVTRPATSPVKPVGSEPRGLVKLSGNRVVKVSDSLRRTNSAPVTGRPSSAGVRNQSVASTTSASSPLSSFSRPVPGPRISTEPEATVLAQGRVNSMYSRPPNNVPTISGNEKPRAPDIVVPPSSPIPRASAPKMLIPPDAPIPRTRLIGNVVTSNASVQRSRARQTVIAPSALVPRNRSPTVPLSRPIPQASSHQVASRHKPPRPAPALTSPSTMQTNSMRRLEHSPPGTNTRPSGPTQQNFTRSPVNIPLVSPASVPPRDPRVRPNTARSAAAKAEAFRALAATVTAEPLVQQRTEMQNGSADRVNTSSSQKRVVNADADARREESGGMSLVPAVQPKPISAETQARMERDRRLLAVADRRTVMPDAQSRQKGMPSPYQPRFRNGATSTSVDRRDNGTAAATATASEVRSPNTVKPNTNIPADSLVAQADNPALSNEGLGKEEQSAPSLKQPLAPAASATGIPFVKQMTANLVVSPPSTVGGNVVVSEGGELTQSRLQQQTHPHVPQKAQSLFSLSQQGQGIGRQRFQVDPQAPENTYNMGSTSKIQFQPQSRLLVAPSAEKNASILHHQQSGTSLPPQEQANLPLQAQRRTETKFHPEPRVETARSVQALPSARMQSQAHLQRIQANLQPLQQNQLVNVVPQLSHAAQSNPSSAHGSNNPSISSFGHSSTHVNRAGSSSATAVPTSSAVAQPATVCSTVPNEAIARAPSAPGHPKTIETDTPESTKNEATPAFSLNHDQPPAYRGRGTGRPRGRPRGSRGRGGSRSRGRARGAKSRTGAGRGGSLPSSMGNASSSVTDIGGPAPPDTDSSCTGNGATIKDVGVSSGAIERPRRGRQKGQTKKEKVLELVEAEKEEQRKREIELDDKARQKLASFLAKRGKKWVSNYGRIAPPDNVEPLFKRHRSLSPPRTLQVSDIAGSAQRTRPSSAPVPLVGQSHQQSPPLAVQNMNPVAITVPEPSGPPQPLSMSRIGNLALTLQGPSSTLSLLTLTSPGRISVNIAPRPRSNRYTMVSPSHLGVLVPARPRVISSPAKLSFSVEPSSAPPRSVLRPNRHLLNRTPTPSCACKTVSSPAEPSLERPPGPQVWSVVNIPMEDSVNITPASRRQPEAQSPDIARFSKRLKFANDMVLHDRMQMHRKTPPKSIFSRLSASKFDAARSITDDFGGVDVPDGRIPRRRHWTDANASPGITRSPTGLRSQPRNIESNSRGPIAGSSGECSPSTGRRAVLQRSQAVHDEASEKSEEREQGNMTLNAAESRKQQMFNEYLKEHSDQGNAANIQALARSARAVESFQSLFEKQVSSPMPAMNLYDRVKAKNAERSPLLGKRQFTKASPKGSPKGYTKSNGKLLGAKRPRAAKSPTAGAKPAIAVSSNQASPMEELRVLTPRPPSHSPNHRSFSLGGHVGIVTRAKSSHGRSSSAQPRAQSRDITVAEERNTNDISPPEAEEETVKFGCLCDFDVDIVPANVVEEVREMDWHGPQLINFWKWRLLLHSHLCEHADKSRAAYPERKAQLDKFAALPFKKLLEIPQKSSSAVESF